MKEKEKKVPNQLNTEKDLPEMIFSRISKSTGGNIAIGIIIGVIVLVSIYFLRQVISIFFIGFMISLSLRPAVDYLESKKVPRTISSATLIFSLLGLLIVTFIICFSILAQEFSRLANYYQKEWPNIEKWIISLIPENIDIQKEIIDKVLSNAKDISEWLSALSNLLISFLANLVGSIINIISVLFITFYFLVEKESLKHVIDFILPEKKEESVKMIEKKLYLDLARWSVGEFTLMLSVGLMSFLGYKVVGIKYPYGLAILAGMLEVIPVAGPFIATVPAVFVGLTESLVKGLLTLLVSIIVQQVENNFLVPKILGSRINFSPISSIFIVITGGTLLGIPGAFLAMPSAIFIRTLLNGLKKENN